MSENPGENFNKFDQNNEKKEKRNIDEKIKYTFSYAFKQQLMRAWQPVPTLTCAIVVYLILGVVFLGIGLWIHFLSNNLFEFTKQYNTDCANVANPCPITFSLSKKIEAPIFIYYEIKNFYQNHRRYFKSRSDKQLRDGLWYAATDLGECDSVLYNRDIHFTTLSIGGGTLDPNLAAFPCGALARSNFNDTFSLYYTQSGSDASIPLPSTGIAWPDDKANKFKNLDATLKATRQWLDIEDERFMVWMRAAATPNFRKPYAKISTALEAGTYRVDVQNNWTVDSFNGEKWFVLSETNV